MERKLLRREGFRPKKIWRAALFASTGLSAVVSLPAMMRAQTTIPSDTTPQGGVVVGGAASITQAPASTTINQGSERAAINWQSFDVGSSAKVQFNQPDASAIALNRVVGGNLSQINGQINANGQIVLINQSGVVFGKGSQVNAENIVVSTSDISTKDFMAGNMAFTGAPNPGAKIINEGNITVKDTGLVGLIAPQVENDGVIVARLGQVVLAGASAFTLDLYGDRLISLDVTKAVQAVDVNGAKVPALVTNRGVILADGGKVTLTAQDADALVTQLINAGGTIRADSVGSQTGTISIVGVGGDISIAGNLLARGTVAVTSGGAIEAVTSGTVSVAPSADIDASGNAGGGVIAIGTDIARAQQGASDVTPPKAAAVNIAQGATLNADATGLGNAGTVTLLSSQDTAFDGAISVQGGAQGGNGGVAEISSDGVISLGGTVLATAINGNAGEILLDPQTLVVSGAATTATISGAGPTVVGDFGMVTVTSVIKNTDLDALNGTIILEAASLISVTASVNSTSIKALSLVSEGSISVTASIDISGSIDLDASSSLFVGAGLTGSSVLLTSGTAGTDIDGGVTATGAVSLGSAGTIFEGSAGSIFASDLLSAGSIGGDASLSGGNTITTLEGFTLGGNLTLVNSGGLSIGGSVSAANISLSAASLTFESGVHAGLLQLASSGTISQGAGTITASTLTGNGTILVSLGDANAIGTLAGFAVTGGTFGLVDTGSLAITGSVSGTDVFISVPTLSLAANVSATAASAPTLGLAIDTLSVASGSFAAAGGTIAIAPHNSTFGIDLAGSAPSNLDIAASLVSAFSAPEILIGHAFGSSASSISIDGAINFGATEVDLPTPGKILDNSGTFTAGTLLFDAAGFTQNPTAAIETTLFSGDGGAVSGNVQLAGASNAIGTLAGFTDNGTFSLVDAGSLNITGTMAGADVYLAVPTLALAAGAAIHATTTAPTLALASDDITLAGSNSFAAGGGTISIAPLTASTVIDFGSASSAGTLGLPGSLVSALDSTASKIIIGKAAIGTQASGIDIDGSVSFGSTPVVDLSTSGTIFDNSGSLTAGTVEFGAPGGFTQTSTAGITATQFGGDGGTSGSALLVGENTISSFTSLPLSASSTLAIFDSGTLTIAGAIDPAAVTLYGTAGLDIGTNVSATLLELGSGGTIIQTGGSIAATTLASFGSIGGDATLASTTNSIGTLGAFTLGGTLDLVDSGSLAVGGTVNAGNITLSAGDIGFTGNVTSSNVLALASTGNITQAGGSLTAGDLASINTITGNVLLTNTANSFTDIGDFAAAGTIDLAAAALDSSVHATLSAPVISLSAASFSLVGLVSAPTELAIGGGVSGHTASFDNVNIGSLVSTGTIEGKVGLGELEAVTVAAIGNFSLTGDFVLENTTGAQVTGLISTPGTIAFVGGGVTETGAGAVDASGIDTGNVGVSGDLLLTGSNTISAIDGFGVLAPGTFVLNDRTSLAVDGNVSGADVTLAAPTIALASGIGISATAGTPMLALASEDITLAGSNTFLAGSGTIEIAPLTASTVIDFGSASSAGTLGLPGSLISALDTTASEIIIGKGPIGSHASSIAIDNSVSFGGTTVIDLSTSGLMSQNSGTFSAATLEFDSAGFSQASGAVISAGTLAGDGTPITGSVFLLGGTNTIGTLNGISLSAGTFALLDTGSLDSKGLLSAPFVTLTSDTLGLNGTLAAGTLLALGGTLITEPGSITTPTLVSLGTIGSATLTGTNTITTLGGFTLSGDLALDDAHALDIAGAVTTAGNITLTGTSLTESTGSVTASTLTTGTGSFSNSVSLSGAANTIASLGAFTLASGTLTLDDTGTLTIANTISAPTTTLSAASSIDLESSIIAPTQLALGSGGSVTQSAGTIYTGNFISDGSIGGDVSLVSANSITALGDFTLGGTLRLYDGSSLDVTGLVQAVSIGGAIVLESGSTIFAPGTLRASIVGLSAASSVDLSGTIDAPSLLALAGGTITQTAGTLIAGSLSSGGATSTSSVSLTGTANTIASLGSFFTDGSFDLVDTGSLDINGSVSAQNISLSVPTIGLDANIDSTLSGGTLALATDAFTITSGTLGANAGTVELAPFTSGDGIDLGGSAANALNLTGNIGTLFGGSPVEYVIGAALGSHASFIDVDGSVSFTTGTVDLATAGTIFDNAGTLSAATLEFDAAGLTQASTAAIAVTTLQGNGGTIAGSVLLAGTANSIGTLGGISVSAGTLALTDAGTLNITGTASAPDIYLTDSNANGINVAAALIAGSGGTIGLAADALAETGGTISAPSGLVRIAPYTPANSIDFGGTGLGGLGLKTGFIDIIGGQVLQIGTGGGSITQENNFTIAPQTLVLDGTSIDLTGSLGVPTLLSLASSGDVSEDTAATISVPTLTGTASGTIGLIGSNAIGTLAAISAGSNITLNNGPSLLIAGLVSTGNVNSITLDDNAGVTEVSGGTLAAGTLSTGAGSIGGDAVLTNTNLVSIISGFTASGDLTFSDGKALGADGISAADVYLTAPGISVGGIGASTVGLYSSNGITEPGSINAGTLTGTASSGDALFTGTNTISTLGSFSVTSGRVALDDTGSLAVAGPVTASSISLSADTLGISGTVDAGTLLALGGGNISESGAGAVIAPTLVSLGDFISGNVLLANTVTNIIGTIGGFTLGSGDTLDLGDSTLLVAAGTVIAPFTTISAAGISITGTIDAASQLALASTGDITESGTGGIDTNGTLTSLGTINGNVLLTDTLDNAISTLGGFTIGSTDTLVLDEAGLLTVAGPVSAVNATYYAGTLEIAGSLSGASQTLSGGNIIIDAQISMSNLLALESAGNVSETSAGTITTPLLTSGGTTIGSSLGNYVLLTNTANSIGTLGGFTVAGTLDLANTGSLDVPGTVQGPFISLTSGTINFSGVVDATSELAIGGSLVTENTGEIITPSLVSIGSIAGDVSLNGATNTISTLGAFTLGGTLDLVDTGSLTVAGPVDGPFISLSSDTIAFTGIVNAGSLLALGSTGTITQTGGTIFAPTLASLGGTIGGDVSLVSSSNTIGTLGAFTLAGTLDLVDTGLLTVAGPVQGNAVSLSSDTIAFTGIVNAGSLLALASTGNITQAATSSMTATNLVSIGTIGGDVSLAGTNAIGTLGGFTVAASHTLTLDDGTLAVAGPVIAPFTTISAAGISITGTISASSELALESTGGITEISAGVIDTPSLTSGGATITGGVAALSGSLNSINTLGGFTAADDISLTDNTFLNVDGPVSAPDIYLDAPGIGIFGGVAAGGTVGLTSTANITESGAGLINAGTLSGASSLDVSLLTGNSITTLGGFSVTSGDFSLDNALSLDIAGLVTVGTATITLEDSAPGTSITEDTGTLIAGTLNSGGTTIAGDVALTNSNTIGALGGFTLGAGTLTLDDTGLLTVNGPVTAPFATLSSDTIAIAGPLDATDALALESLGNVTETGGTIVTPTLTSGGTNIGGTAQLANTLNIIGTLGGFTAGALTLDDSVTLTVTGPVSAPVTTLFAPGIAIDGGIDAATELALESHGSITEDAAGAVATGMLSSGGVSDGGVTLNSTHNSVTTLGQFAAANLALHDQTPLTITAPVAVTGALALLDTGNVTQTGGTISAGTLTSDGGTIGGAAVFNQPGNNIPVLGAFGAVAGLALTDAAPLNLAGNIFTGSTAPLSLTDTGGAITQSGGAISSATLNVNGSNVTLGQANAIGTAGTITAANAYVNGIGGFSGPVNVGTGTFLTAGALSVNSNLSASSNLVLEALGGISQTAGNISAGAATLIAGGDIVLSGVLAAAGDLDLIAGGNISHPAGELTAGTLSGAVGGTVITAIGTVAGSGSLASFNASSLTTDFGTIGNFIMQDSTFALINDGPLMLLGSLVANTVSITTNGALTFEGTSDGSGGGLYIDANPVDATPYFAPKPGDSVITVTNGGITQTGVFNINEANNPTNAAVGAPANLFLYVYGGSVAFATSGELYGPTTNLEISDAQGAISGNVVLQRLVILNALTQSVQLTGVLDGLGGQAAASKGFVDPFPEPAFRFNACPIGSVNCTILPIETLPPGNPLENFDLSQRKRRKLNNNVHLPGVATRDF